MTKRIWFHCLRGIYLPYKYLFDHTEFQYKAKDTAPKKRKKHWLCCGECLLPTPSHQDAKDEAWQPEDSCCSFVPPLHRRFQPSRHLPSQHCVVKEARRIECCTEYFITLRRASQPNWLASILQTK